MKPALVMIISPSYSGSTLLTLLIAAHPDVVTIGERKKFYEKMIAPSNRGSQLCSCGKPFIECAFWSSLKERFMQKHSSDVKLLNFTKFQLYSNGRIDHIARRACLEFVTRGKTNNLPAFLRRRFLDACYANAQLIDAALEISGKKCFLDTSKDINALYFLSAINRYQTYAIFLIRDGRGQVYSSYKRGWFSTIEEASRAWVNTTMYKKRWFDKWNGKKYYLKYETLCSDTNHVMEKVFHFCGLKKRPAASEISGFGQHIMGNEMRLSGLAEIKNREEWRQALSEEQLAIFERIAGETNRKLGYL